MISPDATTGPLQLHHQQGGMHAKSLSWLPGCSDQDHFGVDQQETKALTLHEQFSVGVDPLSTYQGQIPIPKAEEVAGASSSHR